MDNDTLFQYTQHAALAEQLFDIGEKWCSVNKNWTGYWFFLNAKQADDLALSYLDQLL